MGSKLTADGNTYYGRSEDFGPRYVKHFGIEPAHKDGNEYTSVESGFEYKSKWRNLPLHLRSRQPRAVGRSL